MSCIGVGGVLFCEVFLLFLFVLVVGFCVGMDFLFGILCRCCRRLLVVWRFEKWVMLSLFLVSV